MVGIYHNIGKIEMLTEKQLKVVDIFRKNLGEPLTFNQIKKEAKITSNNFLHKTLSNCMYEGILTTKQVGRSLLYSLEINPASVLYLGSLGKELYNLPSKTLNIITREISKKTEFYSAVVFGSYAQNKQAKGSDLDIAIIVPEKKDIRRIEPILESIKRKEILKMDTFVFSKEEFTEMLSTEKENVGKQIFKNHLVFYNPASFYYLIKPWIR